ncbi:MAG: DUF4233 domain-containing protein [Pseudonocardiales bacterium]
MNTEPSPQKSGLRDPARAVRSVAAGALALEGLIVLLALAPIAKLGGGLTAPRIAALVSLAVLLMLTAGLLRRRWAYLLGGLLQVGVVATGVLTTTMYFLGIVFALVWLYVLRLRRTVEGGVRR